MLLAKFLKENFSDLKFNILEIGARPVGNQKEPFYALLDLFTDSHIYSFEPDPELCRQLNSETPANVTFFPIALGKKEEIRPFYEARHPMCSSLYKPNDSLLSKYQNLEFNQLKKISAIETVSLDYFIRQNNISDIDFIKIDIQGAELDVFSGGLQTLEKVVAIVSEVEFVQMYEKQPLFGDVCKFLDDNDFYFHKFLGMGGRALKPLVLHDNPNFVVQNLWTDAMFIKNMLYPDRMSNEELLKSAILSELYGSFDASIFFLCQYDGRNGTSLTLSLQDRVKNK